MHFRGIGILQMPCLTLEPWPLRSPKVRTLEGGKWSSATGVEMQFSCAEISLGTKLRGRPGRTKRAIFPDVFDR